MKKFLILLFIFFFSSCTQETTSKQEINRVAIGLPVNVFESVSCLKKDTGSVYMVDSCGDSFLQYCEKRRDALVTYQKYLIEYSDGTTIGADKQISIQFLSDCK